ncbi:MAG TPA: Ku protein [Steroidobacteraceae bacterium]|nr:Ku protein [Steroidobacteraceae bacterium]
MAARSIASLTISFGLVAIPVKLYSAVQTAAAIRFNLLHKKDGSRLKQQYVCLKEEKVVSRDEIVKGYEFAKDRYVMFTEEEIRALEEAGTQTIELTEFVPLASVDPVYFDRTYYLAPDKGGAKPYTLFTHALRDTSRCAVGRWATRGRDHVVVLRAMEQGLALHQLHFAAEVRPIAELEIGDASVREPELKLAKQLIEQQAAAHFDPSAYTDEVRGRIEAAIQRKVEGEEIAVSELRPAAAKSNVIDLMDALRASLDRSREARGDTERLGERKPAKRAHRKSPAARRSSGR